VIRTTSNDDSKQTTNVDYKFHCQERTATYLENFKTTEH